MKTTRIWPIAMRAPNNPVINDRRFTQSQEFTISTYRSWSQSPRGYVAIRLCEVELWFVNGSANDDFDLWFEIWAGIGNVATIIQGSLIHQDQIPVLDSAHPPLTFYDVQYDVVQGSVALDGFYYGPDRMLAPLRMDDQHYLGMLSKRRPLRHHWQRDARPVMELWARDGVPYVNARAHFDPLESFADVNLAGQIVFEADQ